MAKYNPLYFHLESLTKRGITQWHAYFSEIEEILGKQLPKSAFKYPAWWANESNIRSHVQKFAWKNAQWKTRELDLVGKKIIFTKE